VRNNVQEQLKAKWLLYVFYGIKNKLVPKSYPFLEFPISYGQGDPYKTYLKYLKTYLKYAKNNT
jgi:hypothetical protein